MKKVLVYILSLLIISLFAYYFWPEKSLDTSKKIDKILVRVQSKFLQGFKHYILASLYLNHF